MYKTSANKIFKCALLSKNMFPLPIPNRCQFYQSAIFQVKNVPSHLYRRYIIQTNIKTNLQDIFQQIKSIIQFQVENRQYLSRPPNPIEYSTQTEYIYVYTRIHIYYVISCYYYYYYFISLQKIQFFIPCPCLGCFPTPLLHATHRNHTENSVKCFIRQKLVTRDAKIPGMLCAYKPVVDACRPFPLPAHQKYEMTYTYKQITQT